MAAPYGRGEGEKVGDGVLVGVGGVDGGAGAEAEAGAATPALEAAAAVSPRCCAAEATNVGGAAHQPAEEEGDEAERGGGAGCDKGDRGAAVVAVLVDGNVEATLPALPSAEEDAACTAGKRELICLRCGAAPSKRGSETRLLPRGAIGVAAATPTAFDIDDDVEAALPDDARSFLPAAVALLVEQKGEGNNADVISIRKKNSEKKQKKRTRGGAG